MRQMIRAGMIAFAVLVAAAATPALAGGASCGSCKQMEDVKQRSLEMIKAQILRKIGMKQAPNITGRVLPQVPLHELEIVDQLTGMLGDEPEHRAGIAAYDEDDDDHAKTEKMFLFAQKHPRLRHRHEHDILYFAFGDATAATYPVRNATLYVYVAGGDRRPLPDVPIEVYRVDLTETASAWFKEPRDNHGFVVRAELDGKSIVVTDPDGPDKGKIPYLEITPDAPRRRTKRSLGLNCDETSNQPLCCRYPLTVKFEEIGWDFILAPKSYEAFYCRGECPFLTLQKHAHTHLVTMASSNTVHPCCAPRKMRNITMIYYDVNLNIIMANLPGMVVDRCGCS